MIHSGSSISVFYDRQSNFTIKLPSFQLIKILFTEPSDVHYINAHGTGTPLNDSIETTTIKEVFGSHAYTIPISAQKAMTGHSIGAAGAMEIITTALSIQHNLLVPTINLHHSDPQCDLDYVPNNARSASIDIALSNHFAFGGANAALLLQRYIS